MKTILITSAAVAALFAAGAPLAKDAEGEPLACFIPLVKADAAQRLVYGYLDETKDRAGEIFDYDSSKAQFQKWSGDIHTSTGGKSYGNVRAMHQKVAAGVLTSIAYDDIAKRIDFCAHIVDDGEWAKVEAGVYTGFSPGGRYLKRWQAADGVRYTAGPSEMSIVDLPCIPSATFQMIKADGVSVDIEFKPGNFEPGNEAVKAYSAVLAKAAGSEKPQDFVVKARAELITKHADGETFEQVGADWVMNKAAGTETVITEESPADKLKAALAKGARAAAAIDAPAVDTGPFADLAKGALVLRAIAATADAANQDNPLRKGLWTVGWLSDLMAAFADLQGCMASEAGWEGDGSPLPQAAADIVGKIAALLIATAKEEAAECVASMGTDGQAVTVTVDDAAIMALCAEAVELVKADTDLMAKAGARNSMKDADRIQTIHDKAHELGATCDSADVEKLAKAEGENADLRKAIEDSVPQVENLTALVERLSKRLEVVEAQPAPAKGVLRVTKENDGQPLAKDGVLDGEPKTLSDCRLITDPVARAAAIMKFAGGAAIGGGIAY